MGRVQLSVRLDENEHEALVEASRRARRSLCQQMGVYVAEALHREGYLPPADAHHPAPTRRASITARAEAHDRLHKPA